MKSRKTSLEVIDPDPEKPDTESSMERRPHKPEIKLGREAQARIGEILRAMYNTYVNQGVPQHLEDLVRRLGEQDR